MRAVVMDFETRSIANVRAVGAWMYSRDPSTIPICLAFGDLDSDDRPTIWTYQDADESKLAPLFNAIESGAIIEAHNVFFERCIWGNVCVARYGWPSINPDQWRCTAARCAAVGLPRALDDVANLLALPVKKDLTGKRKMQKVSRPRKPTKHDKSVWNEKQEDLDIVYDYCVNDVVVEKLVSRTVPELTPDELKTWRLDQTINRRGIQIDIELVDSAIELLDDEKDRADAEIERLTEGAVTAITQREKLVEWLQSENYPSDSVAADTVDMVLTTEFENRPPITAKCRAALELKSNLSKSSTGKYRKLKSRTDTDGRTRDTLIYCGASRTRRWAGTGVQFQNLPRGDQNNVLELLVETIKGRDAELIELVFGSVYGACASAIRSAIIAAPGRRLIVADFAAIEARVLAWLAGESVALSLFRSGADIYRDLAVDIFNVRGGPDAVSGGQRFVGKTAVLGLGYQMGAGKFAATLAGYGQQVSDSFADLVVKTFRSKFEAYPKFWYALERAAIRAVKRPGVEFPVGRVTFCRDPERAILWATLPSGGRLAYLRPRIVREQKWGRMADSLVYLGQNQTSRQWGRVDTYGGKWAENLVQATSRDLMAAAMINLESAGYHNVMTIHDEAILEVDDGVGSLADVCAIMTAPPEWATGCPIGAEGFEAKRYRKD